MYKLIYKDIKLLINQFVIAIPIGIIMVIIFAPAYPGFGYAMAAFGTAFILILTAPSIEAKNHTDIVINSLPVLRSEIILAKYLSSFAYAIFALLLVALAGVLIKISPLPFEIPFIHWSDIVITVVSVCILISIYYPLFYRFYNQMIIIFVCTFLSQLLLFTPSFISDYMNGHVNDSWAQQLLQIYLHTPWSLALLGITGAYLFLVVSYLFTVRVYTARDF